MATKNLGLSRFSFFAFSLVGVLLLTACDSGDTRLETRGQISGQVVLDGTPGLNDMSRVQVDLGRGEGSTTPDENGNFSVGDLGPDLYTVTITYIGGLSSDASGSAYRRKELDVELREGDSVHMGEVALSLATGSVTGQVQLSDGEDADGTEVEIQLAGGERIIGKVEGGLFTLDDVPVGRHQAQAQTPGYAASAAGGCGSEVTVNEENETVELAPLTLAPTRPSFAAGLGEVLLEEIQGGEVTWWVNTEDLTVRATTEAALLGRVWRDAEEVPAYAPYAADGYLIETLPEGPTGLFFQFQDVCEGDSEIYTLDVMRDNTAPAVSQVQVGDGGAFLTTYATNLFVTAQDALSPALEMRHQVCTVDGETWDCPAVFEELAYGAYNPQVPLVFAGEGNFGLKVQVRDQAHNETDVHLVKVEVDTVAPSAPLITIGNGSGVITNPSTTAHMVVDDAAQMKLGLVSGLPEVPWQAFQDHAGITFSPEDGPKTLYARFQDEAGNTTDEVEVNVTLDTTGHIEGQVFAEEKADASVVKISVLGTVLATYADASGWWEIAGVPAGVYTLQYEVTGDDAAQYVTAQQAAAVEALGTTTLPDVYLPLARGSLEGFATLENNANHAGALVEVVEAGLTGISVSSGQYAVSGIIAGTYTIRLSRDGYIPQTVFSVTISHQETTTLPAVELALERGNLTGSVFLEDGQDPSVAEVLLQGTEWASSVGTDGSFEILDILPGQYSVQVRATGEAALRYYLQTITVQINAGQTEDLGSITLTVGRGRIQGTATLEDRDSHESILVEVEGTGLTAVTAQDGSYFISDIEAGIYVVYFSKTGFLATAQTGITVGHEEETAMPDTSLLLARGDLSGVVLLEDGSVPTSVQVSLQGTAHIGAADAAGNWILEDIAPGAYTLLFVTGGDDIGKYRSHEQPITVLASETIAVPAITLPLARGSISGILQLEDEPNHGGALVEVVGAGLQTITDAAGNFSIDQIPAGQYIVRLSKENYATLDLPDIGISLDQDTDLGSRTLLLERGTISGVAQLDDAADHTGIQVAIVGQEGVATTDADGNWILDALPADYYNLVASYGGYFSVSPEAVYLNPGETLVFPTEILLTRKRGIVSGRVELEGLADYSGVVVQLTGTAFTTTTDIQGNFQFDVPVGNYDGILATRPYYTDGGFTETITVTEYGIFNIPILTMPAASNTVVGVVTREIAYNPSGDHSGTTITLLGVDGTNTQGAQYVTTSASDGSFAFGALDGAGGYMNDPIPLGQYYVLYAYDDPDPALDHWQVLLRDAQVEIGEAIVLNAVELRALFVLINNGLDVTTTREVTLDFGVSECTSMRYTEVIAGAGSADAGSADAGSADAGSADAGSCVTQVVDFTLSAGDGIKTIEAEFVFGQSGTTVLVEDTIELDQTADINSFTCDTPGDPLQLYDTISLAVNTGEPGGQVVVSFAGYNALSSLGLVDQGDGTYAADYLIEEREDATNVLLSAIFTDPHGNVSAVNSDPAPLAMAIPPVIYNVVPTANVEDGTAVITWKTDEPTTGLFQWGESPAMTNASTTFSTLDTEYSVSLSGLSESEEYFYQITVEDSVQNQTQRAIAIFRVAPNPPSRVVAMAGDGRVDVRWEAPPQWNVVGYDIYRSTDGLTYSKLNQDGPYNHEALLYNDPNVTNDNTYFYEVRALDIFGNESLPNTQSDDQNLLEATPAANVGPTQISFSVGSGVQVWSSRGSPYEIREDTIVEADTTLVIAPGTEVVFYKSSTFDTSNDLTVQGRLAVYGDPGDAIFYDPNVLAWRESEEGLVTIRHADDNEGTIYFDDSSPTGQLDLYAGTYYSGHLFYRVLLEKGGLPWACCHSTNPQHQPLEIGTTSFAALRCVFRDNKMVAASEGPFLLRDSLLIDNATSIYSSPLKSRNMLYMEDDALIRDTIISHTSGKYGLRCFENDCRMDGAILTQNQSDALIRTSGEDDSLYIARSRFEKNDGEIYLAQPEVLISDSLFLDNFNSQDITLDGDSTNSVYLVNSQFKRTTPGLAMEDLPGHATVIGVSLHNAHIIGGSQILVSTFSADSDADSIFANFSTNTNGASTMAYSTFLSPLGNSTGLRARAADTVHGNFFDVSEDDTGFALETTTPAGDDLDATSNYWGASTTALMEATSSGGDIGALYDSHDQGGLGDILYDPWADGAYPMARIEGPLRLSSFRAQEGFSLTGEATDLEDGTLGESALAWYHESGALVGSGSALTLSGLSVGEHIYELWAADSTGQTTKIPTHLKVVDDPNAKPDWTWPDPEPSYLYALELERPDLEWMNNPGYWSTSDDFMEITFNCTYPDCQVHCALDEEPPAPCTSPFMVTDLLGGDHHVSLWPENTVGEPLGQVAVYELDWRSSVHIVQDPGGNGDYPYNANQLELKTCPAGQLAEIFFEEFRTANSNDFVKLYDGNTTSAPLIKSLHSVYGQNRTYNSTGPQMLLHFTSDDSYNDYGFTGIWSCVDSPIPGEIQDPGGSDNYGNNESQLVPMVCAPGEVVGLIFTEFGTYDSYDSVKLYDGNSTSADLIATLDGNEGLSQGYTSTGPNMLLHFTSNTYSTDSGYTGIWGCVDVPVPVEVQDPGGSSDYGNDENQFVPMACSQGEVVELVFTEFETESDYDFVRLYDGRNTEGVLIAALHGTDGLNQTYTSNWSEMLLLFTSNGSTAAPGFTGSWSCVNAPAPGEIQDPGGSGDYGNNENQRVSMACSQGEVVELTFTEFSTESIDKVRLYDGTGTSAVLIASLSNTQGLNQTYSSAGPNMLLHFTSDHSVTYPGYTGTWSCVAE
jgi:hypothetical protein